MESTTIKIMGIACTYLIPGNLAEAIACPGSSEEVVYKHFLKQELYHGSYGNIRAKVSDMLEASGFARKSYLKGKEVTQAEDAEGNKVWTNESGKPLTETQIEAIETETDMVMFKRWVAETQPTDSEVSALVQAAADACPFNPQKRERSGGGEKKANKTNLKIATEIADNGGLERVAAQLSVDLGYDIDVTGDRDAAINTLALAIGENEKREAQERKNKYMAMA